MNLKNMALVAGVMAAGIALAEVPTVCFTFDDGFEEHYTLVAPILEKYGFRGTFNIITDQIGTEFDSPHGHRKMMTWDQVRDLLKRGHDIATHTLSHPDLTELSRNNKTNEIHRQIVASADKIEKETGYRPLLLCHPYCQKDLVVDRITYDAGLVPMGVWRKNFGTGTVANTPTGAGAYIRKQAADGFMLIDLLTHGVTKDGGGWMPYEKVEDFEAHVREVKAMVDAGEAKVDLYKDVKVTSRRWPGFERGIGIGGWLTNYKRFNVLPEKWRFPITVGDLEHFDSYITESDVAYIASCGFDHIRLGFDQIVMEEKPYVYRERTFKLIDNFLDWCDKYKLNAVLNLHKAVGNYCDAQNDQSGLMEEAELQKRFVALWSEFERRYANRPNVAFELMNEVNGIKFEKWNALAQKTLDAIRATNQERWVVIGSCGGNYGCFLKGLKVGDMWKDKRLVFTFHNYEPGFFTHQRGVLNASNLYYNRVIEYPCADVERCRDYYRLMGEEISKEWKNAKAFDRKWIEGSFEDARRWSLANPDKRLWFGEFGTIRHAPAASRVNYMRDCVQIAKEHGFPYSVWNYCSTPNDGNRFSLVDDDTRKFLSQELLNACLGKEDEYDVVIYGSSPAALTSAIAAQRAGKTAVIVSPETRIGGLSTGGLGQTDIGNKAAFGGLALQFYKDVAAYYKDDAHWKYEKREDYLPDGQCAGSKGTDSMWTFEPHAALEILEGWERKYKLDIRRGKKLDRRAGKVKVEGAQRKIVSIQTLDGETFRGRMFVDATYEGDLMAAAGVSYTVGREPNSQYNETISGIEKRAAKSHQFGEGVDPYVVAGDPKSGLLPMVEPFDPNEKDGDGDKRLQAYCFRMCLTDDPSNRIPFVKPANYDERNYELLFRNIVATKLDWPPWINSRMPNRKTDTNNCLGFSTDFIGGNWKWPEASYEERAEILKAHLDHQMGLMWTLANHPRVPEKIRKEVSQWGTCKDEFLDGLGNGWQSQLYVREARRLVGEYVMTEHNCRGDVKVARPIGMGAYGMDSHNVRRHVGADGFVHNEGDVEDYNRYSEFGDRKHLLDKDWRKNRFPPYSIDYGAIVPKKAECRNLFVPVCLSASHMAFGSIRMEPVFFALGEVAGMAASMSLDDNCAVQDLAYSKLGPALKAAGQVVEWKK